MHHEAAREGIEAEQRGQLVDDAARGPERRARARLVHAHMRQTPVERGAHEPQDRVEAEHEPESAELADPGPRDEIRQRRREGAGRHRERADQAVAREGVRSRLVGHAVRQHGVLERDQHAEVAGRRIDGSDEGDQRNDGEVLGQRKGRPGARHQDGAAQQQVAQVVARRNEADGERQQRRSEQRGGRDVADARRVEADRRQVGRQDDDREAVAEAAHGARRIKKTNVGPHGSLLVRFHGSVLISIRSKRVTPAHANAHIVIAAVMTSMIDGRSETLRPSMRNLLDTRVLRSAWTGTAV